MSAYPYLPNGLPSCSVQALRRKPVAKHTAKSAKYTLQKGYHKLAWQRSGREGGHHERQLRARARLLHQKLTE
jgi:hypothetical protein